tara:strand:+ start:111 stop:950 length:840 start_codon:yes stop_codon:yes gene_type:complete
MASETFLTCKPSAKLSPHIAYYYFHQSTDENFQQSFTYYPHYKNALTAYKNVDYKILPDFTAEVSSAKKNSLKVVYSKLYQHLGRVNLNGKFSKIGVAFQPLGIQHFISKNYSEVFPEPINLINPFGAEFDQVLNHVFLTGSISEKANLLDEFFQQQYLGFEEERIIGAVNKIIESKGVISVSALASGLNVHRKTLLRLFQKHLDCSVEEYRKLVRFRFALEKIKQSSDVNLTAISADYYYDQSDFIKQFKKLTQLSPKKFMTAVTKLGDEDTFWNFSE